MHTKHASCGHLKDCILDYGPVFSFWCFSFERYNGIMGDYHTSNVNIGIKLFSNKLKKGKLILSNWCSLS